VGGREPVSEVAAALQRVRERIDAAAVRAGRDPAGVTLVAVSKTVAVRLIREAIDAGQGDFGENRVHEAAAKYKELGTEVRWHFVGRLQRNKVKSLVGWVDLIHSLDRPALAAEIANRASSLDARQEVLAEVNVSGDPGRGGVAPEDLASLLESASTLAGIRVSGLMVMAPVVDAPEAARPYFRRVARLGDEMAARFPELSIHHLSMGMSQDYEIAVEEGATLVRVGEAIFGRRSRRVIEEKLRAEEPVERDVESASNVRGR
jgi:pyridoxal phosphate enzyme (YggS family)